MSCMSRSHSTVCPHPSSADSPTLDPTLTVGRCLSACWRPSPFSSSAVPIPLPLTDYHSTACLHNLLVTAHQVPWRETAALRIMALATSQITAATAFLRDLAEHTQSPALFFHAIQRGSMAAYSLSISDCQFSLPASLARQAGSLTAYALVTFLDIPAGDTFGDARVVKLPASAVSSSSAGVVAFNAPLLCGVLSCIRSTCVALALQLAVLPAGSPATPDARGELPAGAHTLGWTLLSPKPSRAATPATVWQGTLADIEPAFRAAYAKLPPGDEEGVTLDRLVKHLRAVPEARLYARLAAAPAAAPAAGLLPDFSVIQAGDSWAGVAIAATADGTSLQATAPDMAKGSLKAPTIALSKPAHKRARDACKAYSSAASAYSLAVTVHSGGTVVTRRVVELQRRKEVRVSSAPDAVVLAPAEASWAAALPALPVSASTAVVLEVDVVALAEPPAAAEPPQPDVPPTPRAPRHLLPLVPLPGSLSEPGAVASIAAGLPERRIELGEGVCSWLPDISTEPWHGTGGQRLWRLPIAAGIWMPFPSGASDPGCTTLDSAAVPASAMRRAGAMSLACLLSRDAPPAPLTVDAWARSPQALQAIQAGLGVADSRRGSAGLHDLAAVAAFDPVIQLPSALSGVAAAPRQPDLQEVPQDSAAPPAARCGSPALSRCTGEDSDAPASLPSWHDDDAGSVSYDSTAMPAAGEPAFSDDMLAGMLGLSIAKQSDALVPIASLTDMQLGRTESLSGAPGRQPAPRARHVESKEPAGRAGGALAPAPGSGATTFQVPREVHAALSTAGAALVPGCKAGPVAADGLQPELALPRLDIPLELSDTLDAHAVSLGLAGLVWGSAEPAPARVQLTFTLYSAGDVRTQVLALHKVASVQRLGDVLALRIPASDRPCSALEWRVDPTKGAQVSPDIAGIDTARTAAIAAGIGAAESRAWLQYCATQAFFVEVWDAESQLLLGHASIPMARLLRRQQKAVASACLAEIVWAEPGAARGAVYLATAWQCRGVVGAEDIQAGLSDAGHARAHAGRRALTVDSAASAAPARVVAAPLALPDWQLSAAMQATQHSAACITRVTAAPAQGSGAGLLSRRTAKAMAASGAMAADVLSPDETQLLRSLFTAPDGRVLLGQLVHFLTGKAVLVEPGNRVRVVDGDELADATAAAPDVDSEQRTLLALSGAPTHTKDVAFDLARALLRAARRVAADADAAAVEAGLGQFGQRGSLLCAPFEDAELATGSSRRSKSKSGDSAGDVPAKDQPDWLPEAVVRRVWAQDVGCQLPDDDWRAVVRAVVAAMPEAQRGSSRHAKLQYRRFVDAVCHIAQSHGLTDPAGPAATSSGAPAVSGGNALAEIPSWKARATQLYPDGLPAGLVVARGKILQALARVGRGPARAAAQFLGSVALACGTGPLTWPAFGVALQEYLSLRWETGSGAEHKHGLGTELSPSATSLCMTDVSVAQAQLAALDMYRAGSRAALVRALLGKSLRADYVVPTRHGAAALVEHTVLAPGTATADSPVRLRIQAIDPLQEVQVLAQGDAAAQASALLAPVCPDVGMDAVLAMPAATRPRVLPAGAGWVSEDTVALAASEALTLRIVARCRAAGVPAHSPEAQLTTAHSGVVEHRDDVAASSLASNQGTRAQLALAATAAESARAAAAAWAAEHLAGSAAGDAPANDADTLEPIARASSVPVEDVMPAQRTVRVLVTRMDTGATHSIIELHLQPRRAVYSRVVRLVAAEQEYVTMKVLLPDAARASSATTSAAKPDQPGGVYIAPGVHALCQHPAVHIVSEDIKVCNCTAPGTHNQASSLPHTCTHALLLASTSAGRPHDISPRTSAHMAPCAPVLCAVLQ